MITNGREYTSSAWLREMISMETEDEFVPLSASTATEGAQKEVETRAVEATNGRPAILHSNSRVAEIGEAFALGVVS